MTEKPKKKTVIASGSEEAAVDLVRDGEWLPPVEFLSVAVSAAAAKDGFTLNLDGIDHLEASALQILLAINLERRRHGRQLRLVNASPALLRWFAHAGATEHLGSVSGGRDDA